jgi:transposase
MQTIGIDISKKRLHAAWLRDPEQERSRPKAADNTPEGHRQLLAWAERHSQCPPEQLCFVIEATGVYHEALALFLHQAGARVCIVNPYQVKEFARSRGIRTKNDRHDGHVLALFGRERRAQAWQPPPEHVRHLQSLLKRIEALEADRQRECNRLEKATVEQAPAPVRRSLQDMIDVLEAEITRLRRQLDDHIDAHPELNLVAIRWNSAIRAQFTRLTGAGKSKMSAIGAAMRKLVQIAFGVFNTRRPFNVEQAQPSIT